jgi:hypothetical protein
MFYWRVDEFTIKTGRRLPKACAVACDQLTLARRAHLDKNPCLCVQL